MCKHYGLSYDRMTQAAAEREEAGGVQDAQHEPERPERGRTPANEHEEGEVHERAAEPGENDGWIAPGAHGGLVDFGEL